MAGPFLKTILTWRSIVLERKQRRKDGSDETFSRSKSTSSEASDISDDTNELSSSSSHITQHCEATWSPSFRTTRRHAICEENLREYYTFWCVSHSHRFNEESRHGHNHHNDQSHHQNRHIKRKEWCILKECTSRSKANCSGKNSVTYCKHATRHDYAPVRPIRCQGMQERITK